MIKSLTVLLVLVLCCSTYGQDASYYYQPIAPFSYYQAPVVTFVPTFVQKELVVNTWEFRPIVSHNFVVYPVPNPQPVVYFYPRSCGLCPSVPYYINRNVFPYRY